MKFASANVMELIADDGFELKGNSYAPVNRLGVSSGGDTAALKLAFSGVTLAEQRTTFPNIFVEIPCSI